MTENLRRVAAIHDVSGYGKCALTVALPVISAAGVEVCPLPTALLSTNTEIENFTFFDYTPYMAAHLDHWQQLGLTFDCVYSGFLGSEQQIGYVERLIADFESGVSVVDPVMGDDGWVIKTYSEAMCRAMSRLVTRADYATPNVTEACILTGRPYCANALSAEESRAVCRELVERGTRNVVLTGVQRGDTLYNCGIEQGKGYFELPIGLLPYRMHGTGDLFTSAMVAGLMRGYDLQTSVGSAARFVHDCMEYGRQIEDVFERGVAFEPLVWKLGSGIYIR